MKVQDVMTRSLATCLPQDSLHAAAQRLWERDCGCLPVIEADGRPVAMLTDRDVCMAAFTTGRPLQELSVSSAMSNQLVTCRAFDDVAVAGARMARHGVRRLPVLDTTGALVGLLSLNDLAVTAAKEPAIRGTGATGEALRVLLAVSAHRPAAAEPAVPVRAAAPAATQLPAAPLPTAPLMPTPVATAKALPVADAATVAS